MALPTVTAVIHQAMAENHPDLTVAGLERKERCRRNYIQQWCDAAKTLELPPQHETILALARLLGVRSGDLYVAFLKDSTGVDPETAQWQTGLTSQENAILDLYNRSDPSQRHMMWAVLNLFANGFPPSPSTAHPEDRLSDTEQIAVGIGCLPTTVRSTGQESLNATTSHPDALAS